MLYNSSILLNDDGDGDGDGDNHHPFTIYLAILGCKSMVFNNGYVYYYFISPDAKLLDSINNKV